MQVEGLGTVAVDYINELKNNYEQQILKLKTNIVELNQYKNKYLVLEEQYNLLLHKRFARSAEQMFADEKQQLLFAGEAQETETVEEIEDEQLSEVKSYTRKKPGRKPLDPKLPRKENIIDIPECEKTCACGANLTRIGEETAEKLQIIPQQIYVEKTIRPKYACRSCEGTEDEDKATVRIAAVPPSIIPRSIASPSLLSTIFTYKFERHLPY
jgi:transposase